MGDVPDEVYEAGDMAMEDALREANAKASVENAARRLAQRVIDLTRVNAELLSALARAKGESDG